MGASLVHTLAPPCVCPCAPVCACACAYACGPVDNSVGKPVDNLWITPGAAFSRGGGPVDARAILCSYYLSTPEGEFRKIGTIHVTYALPSALFYLVFTLC